MNGYLAPVLGLGSRAWTDVPTIHDALLETWHDALQIGYCGIEVIEGTADGADTLCGNWAEDHRQYGVGHDPVAADWEAPCPPACPAGHRRAKANGRTYCPTAGHRRNKQMVDRKPLIALAFQVGNSTGTADCLRRCKTAGIPVRRWAA